MEGQDIETADILGYFLQTDYDKGDIHIKVDGVILTIPEDIKPDYYKEFIYIDRRKNACIHNPRGLYTAPYRNHYSSVQNSPRS